MKRRLVLARALINDPDLLFLDEPTTGDPQARHVIWERLRKLLNQGKTILLTTHFMDEAERRLRNLRAENIGELFGGIVTRFGQSSPTSPDYIRKLRRRMTGISGYRTLR
jgi:ABC-type multidrug transport system ATPase subunit